MSQRKVALFTAGCKLNQYETEWMGECLEIAGFKRVDFSEEADLYVINTCTVTAQSDYSSRQAIYRAFRKSPDSKIAVAGCYSEIEPDFLKGLPGVSLVLGNEGKKRVGEIILERLYGEKPATKEEKKKIMGRFKHTRALVKIQDGCNQSCAYCIVPKARGREISREANEIVQEIKGLHDQGFKEVVLTGVHIGKYFSRVAPFDQDGLNLSGLLERILAESRMERIRLSSIEPSELSDEFTKLLAENRRLCRHLHIPLQAGSNEILRKMRRDYTAEEYSDLIRDIYRKIKDVTLGADVMVGFPGEKEEDFEKSCELVLSLPLAYVHIFSYSDRKWTLASEMQDKVEPKVIQKRSKVLHQIGKKIWEKHLNKFIDKKLGILVESSRQKESGRLIGLSENYIRVLIDGDDDLKNGILQVKIIGREDKYLTGEIFNE